MAKRNTSTPVVTQARYEALADFRFALRTFLAFSEAAATAVGLTPQQHQALLAVKGTREGENCGIRELAERLLIRHHSAVELVDRLEAGGLVERRPDPTDGRRVQIALTRKSEQLLQSLSIAHLKELREIKPTFQALIAQFD
ncbi:MAG TPA: helix-turn-helix domain-containing protein [Hyphomicrobium sp.]|nr:helix-turn-helix domain-containing protein [Hyphomicrobium sp.]